MQGLSGAALARIRNEKIGFVFQSYNLLPRPRSPATSSSRSSTRGLAQGAPAAALELLEQVGIPEKANVLPAQLSGGQRQRVAIARALANTPALLLADEPTGALDSKTGEEVLGLFQQLNRAGNTVVLVTHDPHIASLAQRKVELRDGLVIAPEAEGGLMFSGAFRERLHGAWVEIRENLGRSTLQTLGVILGVASVLGGFSISDSQRKRSDERWVKLGGMDRLNVQPSQAVKDGQPTALQTANLGLRNEDAVEGDALDAKATTGVAQQKNARARVRSAYADQDRQITGIGGDYLALNGYTVDKGRGFTAHDYEKGQAVAILGAEAASTFFPTGEIVGQTIRVATSPSSSSARSRRRSSAGATTRATSSRGATGSSPCPPRSSPRA